MSIGFPFSYGIFQEYYSTHEPFASHPSGIAVIGTSAMVSVLPITWRALKSSSTISDFLHV